LNASEQIIIQKLLEKKINHIFWDTDQFFFKDPAHSASYFLRKYITQWDYFKTNPPQIIGNNYSGPKNIQIVETQKNIAQSKYIGQLLSQLSEDEINKTAIVLGDENLLVPILYSLPDNIQSLNVTMGMAIRNFPPVVFFELLFNLHLRKTDTLYYKEILSILNHPLGAILVPGAAEIGKRLTRENITHISVKNLEEISKPFDSRMLRILFGDWKEDSHTALRHSLSILGKLNHQNRYTQIERVVLSQLTTIFNNMLVLDQKYTHLK